MKNTSLCRINKKPIFVYMLSKKTKYAFHALTYLGKHRDQKTVLIQDISEEYGISHKFLENILLELKKAGFLGSKKGKGGGYYLIKDPKDIPLSKVIRLLDGPIALLPCVSLNYYEPCAECKDEAKCGLKNVMIQVRDEMLNVLENKTLADILDKE
jgi:Rrf2 family protein